MIRVVAVLETMWDWRQMTSGAGYSEAPRYFRINPNNFSGRRLYRLVGPNAKLLVTNACRELVSHAKQHGKPDPVWLAENLELIELGGAERVNPVPIDVLLVCGKVAQKTYRESTYKTMARVVEIPHPAARMCWTTAKIEETARQIQTATASVTVGA